jgi:hypothetical protein
MRDLWQTTNSSYFAKGALATHPRRLKSSGIKRLIEHALWEQGVRQPLREGEKRHEWKAAHGLRKYFKSKAEQVMKPINVEIMMGHSIGISASYYRPLQGEVLEDYLKAVPLLTLGANNYNLEKQQAENNKHQDEEIQFLKQQVNGIMAMFRSALKGDIALAPDAKGLANYIKYDEKGNAVLRSDK